MSVVINDFQVVAPSSGEAPPDGTLASAGAAGAGAADAEETLTRVHEELRARREREGRLRAT